MEEKHTLAKWLNEEMTPTELAEFEASSDFAIYDKIRKYSGELKTTSFNEDSVLKAVLSSKKQAPKTISLYNQWFFRVASMLVLFVAIGYFLNTRLPENQWAEKGQKTTFTLPDHSEVVLNADSEITYKKSNWDTNRKLKLLGEAYFKVAKGKTFEVATNVGTVTVLGTQFNVKARENRLDVICYEGKVRVKYQNQEVVITKNQSVSFENGNPLDIPNTLESKPSWLNNELTFNKNNLTSVISELERQYNVTINNKSNNHSQLFTGKMPADDIQSALQIIASTYHLQTSKKNDNHFVLEAMHAK